MKFFSEIKHDLPASIIVFFVALPLCLGIALASGAPLFAGIISGVVGGVMIGMISGSALGVSGPAAGLVTIVLANISTLGSYQSFLLVVVLAGLIQIILGFMHMGKIAYYFPSSVIKGMLAGIGLIIILKQIPHIVGYDNDFAGDYGLLECVTEVTTLLRFLHHSTTPGVLFIGGISLVILVVWDVFLIKKHQFFKAIPSPLIVVVLGVVLFSLFENQLLPFSLEEQHLVTIATPQSVGEFFNQFQFPDFSQISNPQIYSMALIMAAVASIETLLSVEASDKLDPLKRVTPTSHELKAQGVGNMISGLIGGLPITQVIVRSSANITFGAKTKLSTILHGIILLVSVIIMPNLLNMIPLASLAAILIVVGYKLTKPVIFKQIFRLGHEQFIPFLLTIMGMLVFDLLKGVGFGMLVALGYLIYDNFKNSYHVVADQEGKKENEHIIRLADEVSFLNKGSILQLLKNLPQKSKITIDGRHSKVIHHDVIEIIRDFQINAKSREIDVELKGIDFRKFK